MRFKRGRERESVCGDLMSGPLPYVSGTGSAAGSRTHLMDMPELETIIFTMRVSSCSLYHIGVCGRKG